MSTLSTNTITEEESVVVLEGEGTFVEESLLSWMTKEIASFKLTLDPVIPKSEQEIIEKDIDRWLGEIVRKVRDHALDHNSKVLEIRRFNKDEDNVDRQKEEPLFNTENLLKELNTSKSCIFNEITSLIDTRFKRFRELLLSYKHNTVRKLTDIQQAVMEEKKYSDIMSRERERQTIQVKFLEFTKEQSVDKNFLEEELEQFKLGFDSLSRRYDNLSADHESLKIMQKETELKLQHTMEDLSRVRHENGDLIRAIQDLHRQNHALQSQVTHLQHHPKGSKKSKGDRHNSTATTISSKHSHSNSIKAGFGVEGDLYALAELSSNQIPVEVKCSKCETLQNQLEESTKRCNELVENSDLLNRQIQDLLATNARLQNTLDAESVSVEDTLDVSEGDNNTMTEEVINIKKDETEKVDIEEQQLPEDEISLKIVKNDSLVLGCIDDFNITSSENAVHSQINTLDYSDQVLEFSFRKDDEIVRIEEVHQAIERPQSAVKRLLQLPLVAEQQIEQTEQIEIKSNKVSPRSTATNITKHPETIQTAPETTHQSDNKKIDKDDTKLSSSSKINQIHLDSRDIINHFVDQIAFYDRIGENAVEFNPETPTQNISQVQLMPISHARNETSSHFTEETAVSNKLKLQTRDQLQPLLQPLHQQYAINYNLPPLQNSRQSFNSTQSSHRKSVVTVSVQCDITSTEPQYSEIEAMEYEGMSAMLTTANENHKYLESEILCLRKLKTEADQRVSEVESFAKNQDYIYKLKLKERSLLLKEMSLQINELRANLIKDKKLLIQTEKKSSTTQFPVVRRHHETRREEAPVTKYDVNFDDINKPRLCRPHSQGQNLSLSRSLIFSSSQPHNSYTQRPTTSPSSSTHQDFFGSQTNKKPSMFASKIVVEDVTGNYNKCNTSDYLLANADRQSKDTAFLATQDDCDRQDAVREEIDELRKKITTLMAHQDIVRKRLQL